MAPPKPTSIPSARPTGTPGKTSLSSGTRGLKFMQRGAAVKPSSSSSSTPAAASTAAFTPPAPAEATASLSSAAGDGPLKKVKGWLGVPQAEAESQWVLPSAAGGGAHEPEAWGDVGMDGAGDDGKLEVEDSYLPFLLGAGKTAGSGGGGKGGRWSYGGLNREVEVRRQSCRAPSAVRALPLMFTSSLPRAAPLALV